MNDAVKFLAVGVVGYVVYDMFFKTAAVASTTTGTVSSTPPASAPSGSAPSTTAGVTTSPGGVVLPAPFTTSAAASLADKTYGPGYTPTVAQLLASAAGGAGQSADQWNYFYSQLSGVNQTYEMLNVPAGTDRGTIYTVQGYLALRSSAGLSGMGRTSYTAYPDYLSSGSRFGQWSRT